MEDEIEILMCISDEKFKKKFEGKNLQVNKLWNLKEKSNELKLELYSDSFVKLKFEIVKLELELEEILDNNIKGYHHHGHISIFIFLFFILS